LNFNMALYIGYLVMMYNFFGCHCFKVGLKHFFNIYELVVANT
jgi:hypothetical protein